MFSNIIRNMARLKEIQHHIELSNVFPSNAINRNEHYTKYGYDAI